MHVDIIGFDSTEIASVTTYKYPQNGLFAPVLDSARIELRYGFQKADTLFYSSHLALITWLQQLLPLKHGAFPIFVFIRRAGGTTAQAPLYAG